MTVKKKRISLSIVSQLTDWEILSAFSYCNSIIKQETVLFQEEFDIIRLFFCDGDEELAYQILDEVKSRYMEEYSKRHCN